MTSDHLLLLLLRTSLLLPPNLGTASQHCIIIIVIITAHDKPTGQPTAAAAADLHLTSSGHLNPSITISFLSLYTLLDYT